MQNSWLQVNIIINKKYNNIGRERKNAQEYIEQESIVTLQMESIDMDDQASQRSFLLPSSMEDFSPSPTMDVTSQGSGAVSDISQHRVSGSRWHVRGGRGRDRRVTVKARP